MSVGGRLPSVGKTTAARAISARLGWRHIEMDEIRKRLDDPVQHLLGEPDVRWRRPPEALRDALVAAGDAGHGPVAEMVGAMLARGDRFVVEGEGVQPSLVERFRGDAHVRAVYVVERSARRIHSTLLGRGRRGSASSRRESAPPWPG